jgi:hypothetical protein
VRRLRRSDEPITDHSVSTSPPASILGSPVWTNGYSLAGDTYLTDARYLRAAIESQLIGLPPRLPAVSAFVPVRQWSHRYHGPPVPSATFPPHNVHGLRQARHCFHTAHVPSGQVAEYHPIRQLAVLKYHHSESLPPVSPTPRALPSQQLRVRASLERSTPDNSLQSQRPRGIRQKRAYPVEQRSGSLAQIARYSEPTRTQAFQTLSQTQLAPIRR